MEISKLDSEWQKLSTEFVSNVGENIRRHNQLLEEVYETQEICAKALKHQYYRLDQIMTSLNELKTVEDKTKIKNLQDEILKRIAQLEEIEKSLPKTSGIYLQIILGDINVSILNPNDKILYKNNYENFKLIMSAIGLLLAALNLIFDCRALQLIYMYLLVWYYCTLTIRESILKLNGSRIKGWWRAHHFITTIAACVLLVWPEGGHWQLFRNQFTYFNVYINFVQCLQFGYQRGLLYRLKELGELNNMELTIEGFHSWMWLGLKFLMPFLIVSYIFEAYNSYKLYHLSLTEKCPWQVPVMSGIFLLLFIGNTIAILLVLYEKFTSPVSERYRLQSMGRAMNTQKRSSKERNRKNGKNL